MHAGAPDALEALVELAPFGSVVDFLDELEFTHRLDTFTVAHISQTVEQVRAALGVLRAFGWQHNDLRCSNVLVFAFAAFPPTITAKLADFGAASAHVEGDDVAVLRTELFALLA